MASSSTEIITIIAIILVTASAGLFVAKQLVETRDVAQHTADESILRTLGNGLDILSIHGRGNVPRTFEYIYLTVKLKQESVPLELSTILLHVNSGQNDSYYNYDSSIDCTLQPYQHVGPYSLSNASHVSSYGVAFRKIKNSQSLRVLDPDDVITICAPLTELVGDADHMIVGLYPDAGTPTKAEFRTPDVLRGSYFQIYPPTGSVY